jgi:hypothetical protein
MWIFLQSKVTGKSEQHSPELLKANVALCFDSVRQRAVSCTPFSRPQVDDQRQRGWVRRRIAVHLPWLSMYTNKAGMYTKYKLSACDVYAIRYAK